MSFVSHSKAVDLYYSLTYLLLLLSPSLQVEAHKPETRRHSRLLLQHELQTSVVIIKTAPDNEATINDPRVVIHFEVRSGVDAGTRCRLEFEDDVIRDWEPCSSPHTEILQNDGSYTFRVMADQGSGTISNLEATRQWTLDRAPPDTVILGPSPSNTTGDARFDFTGYDAQGHISRYECKLDSLEWEVCRPPQHISNLPGGRHIFLVRAVDKAGNIDPHPAFHEWTVTSSSDKGSSTTQPDSESASAGGPSERLDPSGMSNSAADSSEDEDLLDLLRSNMLLSLLIIVFALVGLFFICYGACKCWTHIRHQVAEGGRDGAGSQLTSLESDVFSGGIDMSGFSSIMAISWPENLRRFKYVELRDATGGFAEESVLGEGGFGKVYSGTLEDGRLVAVKKLEKRYASADDNDRCCSRLSSGQQGDREFFVEVATMCRARHTNVLRLLGVCIENGNRVCVFDLMDWGSARSLLDSCDPRFTWEARLKAAVGTARGLACLHESVDPPIVHRDLKSENILMNRHGEAHISDFGLCTLARHEARQRHLRRNGTVTVGTIRGTFGYLAPEVIGSGRVSTKSDVYAFGVFLLELLTGRRPIETARPSQDQDLVRWTLRHIDRMDRIIRAVDPLISYDVEASFVQITAFVELAASCLNYSPSSRPSASEAARRIEELMNFKEHQATSIKGKSKKGSKGRVDEFCLAPKLSETSGTIPTGIPFHSCLSEGEFTPHAATTPMASTSCGRITELELLQGRFQDSPAEEQSPHGIFSPTYRDHGTNPGPSTAADARSQGRHSR